MQGRAASAALVRGLACHTWSWPSVHTYVRARISVGQLPALVLSYRTFVGCCGKEMFFLNPEAWNERYGLIMLINIGELVFAAAVCCP